MLRTLYIRDYAIIDELEVDFENGLNILTGETGAGKSIMIGALKLMLGERASSQMIRSGAKKAIVEGIFDHISSPELDQFLEESEIELQPVLILRREITKTHSRGYINDSPATLSLMRKVAAQMIDLHGQHEHQSLLRTETHRALLDDFGGLAGLRSAYEDAYESVSDLIKRREELLSSQGSLEVLREQLAYEIEEIDAVSPLEDEEEELRKEMHRLAHAERLGGSAVSLHSMLYACDDSTTDQLSIAYRELRDLARIDPTLEAACEEINQASISVSEIAAMLQEYSESMESNPTRLADVRERLGALDTLKRKYGGTIQAVLAYQEQIADEYATVVDYDAARKKIEQSLAEAQHTLSDTALLLSTRRQDVAGQVGASITGELTSLGMVSGRFNVRIDRHEEPTGWITLKTASQQKVRYKAYRHGMDDVEFLITTNVGEAPRPLVRVASGGEISRIMLAIKRVLAEAEQLSILVFDEIDTGISGSIARKVGKSMADLARHHQIIAITHLPQIAALAQAHYVVEKHVVKGRATTQIRRLGYEESLEHVAMLITGAEVSDAMRQSAKELMEIKNES
jgi:DNA repair protein RecN (Recombination protein N)